MGEIADRVFVVAIDGYSDAFFRAPTKVKARYRAFLAFKEALAPSISFHAFLVQSRVRASDEAEAALFGPGGDRRR